MEVSFTDTLTTDLSVIEKNCWERLLTGALRADDPMHNAVVANAGAANINMRTVVLRKAIPPAKQLSFYTDIRSGKWAELLQQNKISWLFYDAEARIQIRTGSTATLHQVDELADKAWEETRLGNRKNYLSNLSPSAEIANPLIGLPPAVSDNFTKEESEAGRKNFGVVICTIDWMEWLWLGEHGHRRANFVYGEDGNFTANWLVP